MSLKAVSHGQGQVKGRPTTRWAGAKQQIKDAGELGRGKP